MNKIKFELSTRTLMPVLIYMEKTYDREELIKFVKETEMDIKYLEDQRNWISYEYYNMFLKKLVAFTNDEKALYEAGKYVLSKEAYGYLYSILIIAKIFASPNYVYKKIFELSSAFTNIGKFEMISNKNRKIKFKYKLFKNYKQSKLNCLLIQGTLANVPCFWGLPAAKVKELKCAAESGDSCIYEFAWLPRPIRSIIFAISASLILLSEIIFFFIQKTQILSIKDILLTASIFGLIYLIHNNFKYKESIKEQGKLHDDRSKDLEDALTTSRREYKKLENANLQIVEKANKLSILNYISEEISSIAQEEKLLLRTIRIIIDCIGYDRGFFVCFNNTFVMMEKPVGIFRLKEYTNDEVQTSELSASKNFLHELFHDRKPVIINAKKIFKQTHNYDILFVPIKVHNIYFYSLFFDYSITGKTIKKKNLMFFSTIARQIEIALNNIYSTKAALNILSSIPSSIVVFDQNTLKISYVNSAYLKNNDVEYNDVLGKNVLDFLKIPAYYQSKFSNQVKKIEEKNTFHDQEYHKVKETIGYTLFKMPVGVGGKNEIGMIMKDITQQKNLQEQLVRGEKLTALGTLASGIAHEINNPLYGILGTAEVIEEETDDTELKELAKNIIDYSVQCSDIVKDLSSYSRSLREEIPKEIDINNLIDESIRIISYSPKFINIKIKKNIKKIPTIYALGGEIRQVFMNIINNAIQAMKGKGELKIKTCLVDNYVNTVIEDTGPGIPKKLISKIFDPFFTTKAVGEGTGIGLNIVYRLVTKYKGFIYVESEQGKGAKFTVQFPVKEEK